MIQWRDMPQFYNALCSDPSIHLFVRERVETFDEGVPSEQELKVCGRAREAPVHGRRAAAQVPSAGRRGKSSDQTY